MVKNVFQLISTVAIKQKKKVIFQQYILHESTSGIFFAEKKYLGFLLLWYSHHVLKWGLQAYFSNRIKEVG